MSVNGKHIAPSNRAPEVGGENICYVESDAPIVPCMMPTDWPGANELPGIVNRYRWAAQTISATREIRFFYRRNPRLVEIRMNVHIGFPFSLPTAQYVGVHLMDARSTRPLGQAVFKEQRRYVGRDTLAIDFTADMEFGANDYLRFVADLTAARRICVGPEHEDSVFSDMSLSQYGLKHVAATLDQAHKDLAQHRSIGTVASNA